MKYTEEQELIIKTDVPCGKLMKVTAFAGCAKTTTLRAYAIARPDKSFLYLAFNTAVAKEAKDSFPSNTDCRTTHSLAYRQFGYKYKNKLGFLRPYILCDELDIKKFGIAKYIIDVVVKYLSSDDPEIKESHLVLDKDKTEEEMRLSKDAKNRKYLVDKANELWKAMQDVDNIKIPMTHDGYLKLFQLSAPQLDYDYILLDEAHDTNDVTLDIFLKQTHASKILVGDSHQSIYQFRHAYDAIQSTSADIELYLSTSFRFGDNIAKTANQILTLFKDEKKAIKGFQTCDTVGMIDTNQPYTVIARTNGALFDEAAQLVSIAKPKKFGFIGTIEKEKYSPFDPYYFGRIMDVYNLYMHRKDKIKDVYIKRFIDFDHFKEVVNDKDAPDVELASRARVVSRYTKEVPKIIDAIVANSVDPRDAHVLFTTAHKSKGLEWNQVKLTHDYVDLVREDERTGEPRLAVIDDDVSHQEINLLYVGVTRGKQIVQVNGSILSLWDFLNNR